MASRLIASAGALLALAACGKEASSCLLPEGTFVPRYRKLDGDCPPPCDEGQAGAGSSCFMPISIPVEHGRRAAEQWPPANRIDNSVVFKGCFVQIEQSVIVDRVPREEMQGEMEIHDGRELRGVMTRTERDGNSVVLCQGTYDMVLSRNRN